MSTGFRACVTVLVAVALAVAAGLSLRIGAAPAASDEPLLAFTGVHWNRDLAPAGSQIYLVRTDGTGLRRLTRADARSDTDPAWSPDGRRLAFARLEGRGWRLYVMNADGSHLRALTKRAGLAEAPTWSPDGHQIAFVQLPNDLLGTGSFSQQVYVLSLAGGRTRRLTGFDVFKGGAGSPEWSPDGKRIIFSGATSSAAGARTDLWVARPDGTGIRRLVAGATQPAWSPDGLKIAFVRGGDVYTARADGKRVRRLTRTPSADAAPSWSPDGERIAFAALHRAKDQARDTMRIFVIGADGTGLRAVTPADPLFWADAPAWRPFADR